MYMSSKQSKSTTQFSEGDLPEDLFTAMKGKKNNDKKSKSEESSETKEQKKISNQRNSLMKHGFDYYKILGIPTITEFNEGETPEENIKKYEKLVKNKALKLISKYHTDKRPKGLTQEEKEKYDNTYKLIREAADVLTNETKRKFYDLNRQVTKSKDFQLQKNGFEEFIKLQESEITEEKKGLAKLDFQKEFDKKNKLIGYDPESSKIKLTNQEIKQRLNDRMSQRDLEDIELTKPNMFENRSFNPSEFHKNFEKNKKKEERRQKIKQESGQLTKFNEGFTAFNDDGTAAFIGVDDDYGNIFGDDKIKGNNIYSGLNNNDDDNLSIGSISSDDIDVSYITGHRDNRDTDDANKKFKEFMKQRDEENSKYNTMKYNEFKDASEDQFGISKQFGTMIGDNFTDAQKIKQITNAKRKKEISYGIMDAYNRLIGHDNE